jgi:tRNA (guanine37-N1)-methyltransferase
VAIRIETLGVFPQMFEPVMSLSIMGRARRDGYLEFEAHDLRHWTHDRYHKVDDEPYGGGQGMLMKCTPFFEALDELAGPDNPAYTVFFTPTGEPFNQAMAQELSQLDRILFVCGHYEGMDERVYSRADRCISLGDYVLTGGELAALTVTDAVVRLIPGVLGNDQSCIDESFGSGLLEYSQFTRPAVADGLGVPAVLLSGDHAKVDAWRRADSIARTCARRPDLIAGADLTAKERRRAEELIGRLQAGEDYLQASGEVFDVLRQD